MDEYIKREYVIDAVLDVYCNTPDINLSCEKFEAVILEIPTADVEPVRHGRWEIANDGTHFCSHCGCDAPYAWDDIDRNYINSADDVPDRISNYCPNCGADMRGDKSANK